MRITWDGRAFGLALLFSIAWATASLAAERATLPRDPGVAVVMPVPFSPDSRLVATWNSSGLALWDAGTGKPASEVKMDPLAMMRAGPARFQTAIGSDGKIVAMADGFGVVRVVEPATGKARQLGAALPATDVQLKSPPLPRGGIMGGMLRDIQEMMRSATGSGMWIQSMTFSSDNRFLLVNWGLGLTLFDLKTGKVRAVDSSVRVVQQRQGDGSIVKSFVPTADPVWYQQVAFMADGEKFVCARGDGTFRTGNTSNGKLQRVVGKKPKNPELVSAVSVDGAVGAILDSAGLRLVDTSSGKVLRTVSLEKRLANGFIVGAQGNIVAAIDNQAKIRIIDTVSGKNLGTIESDEKQPAGPAVGFQVAGNAPAISAFSLSPDGKTLATVSGWGTVKLWDVPYSAKTAEPAEKK